MNTDGKTIERKTWRRLLKNKGAACGLFIIILSVLTAIFCYFIAPDSSPNANRIILEIRKQKPGFKKTFVTLPKENRPVSRGFFHHLLFGKQDAVEYIPVNSYELKGRDSVTIKKFIDDGVEEEITLPTHCPPFAFSKIRVKEKTFILGTDKFGRDVLSRIIIGTRVSLSVGIIAVIISLSIGVILGSLAGYFRGRTDNIVMWFVNVVWSIPTLLLVFAITFALGKGFWQVFIAVGLTMWVNVARLVRGQVLAVRELEYIEATRALGFSHFRTIFRHILPNIVGPILVIAASNFASAIVVEAGLSFLGAGVQPPQPSWGLMIKENYSFIITQNPVLALAPGIAIMLLVLAFNLLGNGLRDAMDVR
jgi:peptide/nickel transport system permease protein